MKIHELVISAFGPYKNKQVIDFTPINHRQLFLITGPTGAGKTCIFDAITYALYGQSSGNNRDNDTFRSDFASVEDETYVSLTFEIRGKVYNVYRSPKQEKSKLRGEGLTIKQAEAILRSDNYTITGVNEVDKKIKSLLGIDYHQFRQIVMLPQGEFRKLLEASSQDREQIFRNLFKTYTYQNIQEKLKTKANTLKQGIEDIIKILERLCENIIYGDNESLQMLIHNKNKDYEFIISALKNKNYQDEVIKSNLHDKIVIKEKTIYQLTAEWEKGNIINQKLQKLEQLKNKNKELEEKSEEVKNEEIIIKKIKHALKLESIVNQINRYVDESKDLLNLHKANLEKKQELEFTIKNLLIDKEIIEKKWENLDEIKEKIILLKDKLAQYQILEEKILQLESLKSDKDRLEKELSLRKDEISKRKLTIDELENKYLYLHTMENKYQSLEALLDTKRNEKNVKTIQYQVLNDIFGLEKKSQELGLLYQKQSDEYNKSRFTYEKKFTTYLLGQAGILAKDLQPNMPCPVCGSTHHPHKAEILDNTPSEQELEELKKEVEENEKIKNDVYTTLVSNKTNIDEKYKMYTQLTNKVSTILNIEQELIEISKNLEQIKENITNIKKELTDLEQVLKEKDTVIDKLKQAKDLLKVQEEEFNSLTEKYNELLKTYYITNDKVTELKESLDKEFPNKVTLEKRIQEYESYVDMICKEYQKLSEEINIKQKELIILETSINNICANISEKESKIDEEKKLFNNKLKELGFTSETEFNNYYCRVNDLEDIENKIRLYYEEKTYVEKTLRDLYCELKGQNYIDLNFIKEKQTKEKEELEFLRNEENALNLMIQTNLKIYQELITQFKNIKQQISNYEIVSEIAKVANGDNSQKLTFERYVLAAYFDEIIRYANMRLNEMTNNRYYLVRKGEKGKGRSQQGLDLEVIDNYTGKSRLVNTLSGGESFIASLALALGTSDVVQSDSGGIELETIFIDEGFGTLDPESLDHAISTLLKIQQSGRLVGIISHVQELKERIDVKLEITPSPKGSIAKFVY